MSFSLAAGLIGLLAGSASAEEPRVAVTLSPLHLPGLTLEVNTEFRLQPRYSVAVILGGGVPDGGVIGQGGGQIWWYMLGDYSHGVQLGAELLGVGGVDEQRYLLASASFSPLIGGKHTFDSGFTIAGQLGPALYWQRVRDLTAYISGTGVSVALNTQVGWSF